MKWLDGNKTYLGLIAAGVAGVAVSLGWVDATSPAFQTAMTLIGTWTGVAITHKANKAIEAIKG